MLRLFRANQSSLKVWRPISTAVYSVRHNSSASKPISESRVSNVEVEKDLKDEKEINEVSLPWYLRDDITSLLVEKKEILLPEIPPHAPPQVEEFLTLMARDYGMDNIMLFDMTQLPDDHEYKENNKDVDFIVVATGKSEKHIYKAANELRTHLKHKYNAMPSIEGMVSSAITPSMRRRLLRRARKGPLATDNDYGKAANSWVICHHDGIDMHMLTAPRREELNLESLWCKPEDADKFSQDSFVTSESDHIFSGIRRYHTFARAYSLATSDLESIYYKLQSQPVDAAEEELKRLQNLFEQSFLHPSIKDHGLRFQFWKTLHLARPDLVSLAQVEDALLAKYCSAESLKADMTQEKIDDITEYVKLLIDTPTRDSHKALVDLAFDRLSKIISTLYTFSNEKFSLAKNPQLVPLLWRLTYVEVKEPVIGSRDVDRFIQEQVAVATSPGPVITMASNRARDILHLIGYHTKTHPGSVPTASLRELILFTYGNAGKWDKFWQEWDNYCFEKNFTPAESVEKWTRICVYLSMRRNKAEALRFLENYWNNASSVAGSVYKSLQANGEEFNSPDERVAFKRALTNMIAMFETPEKVPFEGILLYVDQL